MTMVVKEYNFPGLTYHEDSVILSLESTLWDIQGSHGAG
jgi:hypothetical protein